MGFTWVWDDSYRIRWHSSKGLMGGDNKTQVPLHRAGCGPSFRTLDGPAGALFMIEAIVSGVVLAAFTGSAFVAYAHPKFFRKHALAAFTLLVALAGFWYLCTDIITTIYQSARDKITKDPEAVQAITDSITSIENVSWWGYLIFLVATLYGVFLVLVVTRINDGKSEPEAE